MAETVVELEDKRGQDKIVEEDSEEAKERPFEYSFIVIKRLDGNLGISPVDVDYPPTTGQIYDGCHSILREMDAQDIANTVAMKMMNIFQQASNNKPGKLVVPQGVPRR